MADRDARYDGGPQADLAITEVREAARRLRVALDALDTALNLLGQPRLAFEALVHDAPETASAATEPAWNKTPADAAHAVPVETPPSTGPATHEAPRTQPLRDDPWATPFAIREGAFFGGASIQRGDDAPAEEDEAREQVRRAVEQFKNDHSTWAAARNVGADWPSLAARDTGQPEERGVEDVDVRDRVDTHALTDSWQAPEPDAAIEPARPQGLAPETETAVDPREEVRRAVEAYRREAGGPPVQPEGYAWPREQVGWNWQTQTAAEPSEGGRSLEGAASDTVTTPESPTTTQAGQAGAAQQAERFYTPATIMIDDPEGRVELVRVYRCLARLQVAATATLAKYSSHAVSVQLEEVDPPSEEDLVAAIRYAFERDCRVDFDGNRVAIRLTGPSARAA